MVANPPVGAIPGPSRTLADEVILADTGLQSSDEDMSPQVFDWLVDVRAGVDQSAFIVTDTIVQASVTDPSASVDTVTNEITYREDNGLGVYVEQFHNFIYGEAIQFTGSNRPTVAVATQISNSQQFYVEPTSPTKFKVHASRAMAAAADFDGQGINWSIKRYKHAYISGNTSGNVDLYNTIGSPQNVVLVGTAQSPNASGHKGYPLALEYSDNGVDLSPNEMPSIKCVQTGLLKNGTIGNRTISFVADVDCDVRAHGLAAYSSGIGVATADNPTNVWTLTAHGLFNYDLVMIDQNGSTAIPSGTAAREPYWVERIDANTFKLHTSVTLSAASVLVIVADGTAVVGRVPDGSLNRVRFDYEIPNTISGVSNIATMSFTGATYDYDARKITSTSVGAFANVNPGDEIDITSGTDWTPGRYKVESVDVIRFAADQTGATVRFIIVEDDGNLPPIGGGGLTNSDTAGTIYACIPSVFEHRIEFRRDNGQDAAANMTECGEWFGELIVRPNGYVENPSTSDFRRSMSFNRSRPTQGANFAESRRIEWAGLHALYEFPAGAHTTFQYAKDALITGADSGATGSVVYHDTKRRRVTYRALPRAGLFRAGEAISGSAGTIDPIGCREIGPMPMRLVQRVAVLGKQTGACEVNVKTMRLEARKRGG